MNIPVIKLFFFFTLLFCQGINAQTTLTNIPLESNIIKKSYEVETKDGAYLFLINDNSVHVSKLSNELSLSTNFSIKYDNKYLVLLGHTLDSIGNPTLYWLTQNNKELITQNYDINKEIVSKTNKVPLALDKEKIIAKYTYNNQFFLLTTIKNTNSLHLIKFNSFAQQIDNSQINLDQNKFYNQYNEVVTLYDSFRESPAFYVKKIDEKTPTTISAVSSKRKLYLRDNMIYITLDNSSHQTIIIGLDFLTKQGYSTSVSQGKNIDNYDYAFLTTNSFLFEDKMLQTRFSRELLNIDIKDLDGKLLKNYALNRDKDLTFVNGKVLQSNSDNEAKAKELLKTNQVINRISASKYSGATIFPYNSKYIVCYGGVTPLQDASTNAIMYGGMAGGLIGGLVGAAIGSAFDSNLTDNLNEYNNNKVILAYSILDKDFNHDTQEVLPEDKQKKIREFVEASTTKITYTMLFQHKNKYHLGTLEKNSKQFNIIAF